MRDQSGSVAVDRGVAELPRSCALPVVDALGFTLVDCGPEDLLRALEQALCGPAGRPFLAFALHVGGLLAYRDADFRAVMSRADVVYADGVSVEILGRAAGAKHILRAPTTDLGWDLMRLGCAALRRPVRVAAIGGPAGLAREALQKFEAEGHAIGVFDCDGYAEDWAVRLQALRAAKPDLVFVGLGVPLEMVWAVGHVDELPHCPILTCGGWFGHVVGHERRAPVLARRLGIEWVFRWAQDPRRLTKRYVSGLFQFPVLAGLVVARRLLGARRT